MSIGSTITAPSPLRPTFAPPRTSPLNPTTSRPSVGRPPTNTRTHLSNLDRLLLKQSPPQQSNPPLDSNNSNDNRSSDNGKSTHPKAHKINRGNGNGLFNALNLNTIIPSLRNPATEAMSPRSLTQLQRLLDSPRPSPKSSIASRWKLYHGSDNWSDLLDPIDENLRRELVRYGDLVQAAYHAFHSNPSAPPSKNRHVILPDRSYKVTKSLYATSSVQLPKWLDGAAPWMTQRSSWIGYVAVCDNPQEIKRMGRRDVVIALRGTATCMEWAENFRAGLVPIDSTSPAKVANGFHSLYKTSGEKVHSLSSMVVAEVRRLMELYKGEELSITVTGHSLGAAIALFVADEISTCAAHVPNVAVFSFGGPRVGNKAFADRLERNGVKVLRVVNANDVVTRVPGVLPREEIGKRIGERWGSLRSYVMQGYDGYVHAGTEFRVDSKRSPYLKPDTDPNCSHDLESYLHLVDGFAGSDYPFRSDAKRSLSKLMIEQRSNLRSSYVTHAQMLGFDGLRQESELEANGFLRSSSGYLPSPTS